MWTICSFHPVIQYDDAVGDVLLEAVAGKPPLSAFTGDDGGHALFLKPPEEAPQLGPQNGDVGPSREERFDGVEDHPFGADRVNGVPQPDEEPFEIVLAGLFDFTPLDVRRC